MTSLTPRPSASDEKATKEALAHHDIAHDSDDFSSNQQPTHEPKPSELENDDSVNPDFQQGVQGIEAITVAWSKTWLVIAYVLIWATYFLQGLVTSVSGTLLPFVASGFAEHSLAPTTGVISAVVGGVTNRAYKARNYGDPIHILNNH
jgi:hypothetical protein